LTTFAMGFTDKNLFIDRANRIVVAKLSSWKKPIDYVPLWLTTGDLKACNDR